MLTTLRLDESASLEFEISVSGTYEKLTETRFIIEEKGFGVICKCEKDGDTIKVNIPKLKGIFESGIHKSWIEVIIDNKIFVPLTEEIEFEAVIEVKQTKKASVIKESKPIPTVSDPNSEKAPTPVVEEVGVAVTSGKVTTKSAPSKPVNLPKIDKSWKTDGFKGIDSPFK